MSILFSDSNKSTVLKVVSLLEVAIFCPIKVVIDFHDYPIGICDLFSQAHFWEDTDKSGSLEGLVCVCVCVCVCLYTHDFQWYSQSAVIRYLLLLVSVGEYVVPVTATSDVQGAPFMPATGIGASYDFEVRMMIIIIVIISMIVNIFIIFCF